GRFPPAQLAAPAVNPVVAGAAEHLVMAAPPGAGAVTGAAVDGELDQPGQAIARRDRVVAAVGVEDQILSGADIEGERGRADAVEADARAVGSDGEHLGGIAAVDLNGVVAGAALVDGAAVAGVPDHPVVAGLTEDLVVPSAAGQHVVAGAPEQGVRAVLAQQGVVAALAEEQIVAGPA